MPLARRLRLGGLPSSASGAGGRGLVLGPSPNVFGATIGPPDGTVAAATNRAAAEALRDTQLALGGAQAIEWETGNRVTGSDYYSLQSVEAYTSVPWGTSTPWIIPQGSTIEVGANGAYTIARDSSAITLTSGKLRVRAYTYDRPNTIGRTIKHAQTSGDKATVILPSGGSWAKAYLEDSGLNIRLFYMKSGVEGITHQVWQSNKWVDNLSVTGLAGKQGLPGAKGADGKDGVGASFSAVSQGNLVTVDASQQAADTGIDYTDVVVDSDLSTVATTGAYSDLSGLPVVLDTLGVQTLVGAMFTSNTETGITATFNPSTRKIDLIVGSGLTYSPPVFSKVLVTGLSARQESDFTVSGSYTLTWELANHANISGTLTLSQVSTLGGTTTSSIRKSGITPAATGSETFDSTTALLDAVGENVEFRISGTDKQGSSINGSFQVTRVAQAVASTLYWGRLSTAAAFTTISTLSSSTLPGGGSKQVASNSDVAGNYRFPLGQPNGWIGWFIPTSVGTYKNVFQNNFNVNNTITLVETRTISGVEYRIYRHTREQKGDSNIDFEFRV